MNLYHDIVRKLHYCYPNAPWSVNRPIEDGLTLYPNLCAELLNASPHFDSFCEHAHINAEILVNVIEDGEPLTTREISGLSGLLNCSYEYLTSPVMGVINPNTRKGKLRLLEVENIVKALELNDPESYESAKVQAQTVNDWNNAILYSDLWSCAMRIPPVIKILSSGRILSFAAYRRAITEFQNVMRWRRFTASKPTLRNYRLHEQRKESE